MSLLRGRLPARRLLAAAAGLCCLVGCGEPLQPTVTDLHGTPHQPLRRSPGMVHVIVFLSQTCPIANAYAPRLRELAAGSPAATVRWYLVLVDPDPAPTTAKAHAAAYQLPGQVLLDPHHRLVAALAAERTPEAFVLADHGSGSFGVAYRGLIDDQWQAIGARSATASQHFLRDAIVAALAGRPPEPSATEPVGCRLPQPQR